MSYEDIQCSIDSKVLTVTLNRPERLNAFNANMLHELLKVLEDADSNDNIRAIIFTGSGRGFCAGADLSEGSKTFQGSAKNLPALLDLHCSGTDEGCTSCGIPEDLSILFS